MVVAATDKRGRGTNKNGITRSSGRCTAGGADKGTDKAGTGEEIKEGDIIPGMPGTR